MSSTQVHGIQVDRTSTAPQSPNGDEGIKVPTDESQTSPEQIRLVVRLIQCQICSLPLRDPFILPCGRTVCKKCLPRTHERDSISFFATPDRLQGIWCPFLECTKEHAVGDCSPDVALARVVSGVEAELGKGMDAALDSDVSTHVVTRDQWEEAGVPSLRGPETTSLLLKGGRLLATYTMAQMGALKYDTEVAYTSLLTDGQATLDTAVLTQVKEAARSEADCQICYALFYDPVTTPCGHTFCRSCLQRVLDHAKYCPVCRRGLSIQPVGNTDSCPSNLFPSNLLLSKMITYFWADLVEERRLAVIAEGLHSGNREYDIAVFVCTLSFPTMPTFLHVFEPRYRLMIRRALEGDRTFGMVSYNGSGFVELGTRLRIVNVEFFPDGRSLVETIGTSRFRIIEHDNLDGYVVAKIRPINDVSIVEEEEMEATEVRRGRRNSAVVGSVAGPVSPRRNRFPTNRAEVETTATSTLMAFGAEFVQRMQHQSVGWLTAQILEIYGDCPEDPAIFPWWFANILPVRDSEKYRLLSTTSVRERLKICCGWIFEWERNS
ncbi:ATP-dependent protease La domain-containing protein [Lasiosphaeria hispida]|uniref:ATP-dependent protease La domain-containing protein n=1 Tax=Lasiosphaeria hispida TaxID=260671 RepID=A0AAJ0HLR8_9PEZI|nr:ATP-dependent protease La domain-containing protein [Lasiosphaeria hispida]